MLGFKFRGIVAVGFVKVGAFSIYKYFGHIFPGCCLFVAFETSQIWFWLVVRTFCYWDRHERDHCHYGNEVTDWLESTNLERLHHYACDILPLLADHYGVAVSKQACKLTKKQSCTCQTVRMTVEEYFKICKAMVSLNGTDKLKQLEIVQQDLALEEKGVDIKTKSREPKATCYPPVFTIDQIVPRR